MQNPFFWSKSSVIQYTKVMIRTCGIHEVVSTELWRYRAVSGRRGASHACFLVVDR